MPYVLQELPENGEPRILGEPVHDVIVAKVIASRRAVRMNCVTVVIDNETGKELARFDPTASAPKTSVTRMRADAAPAKADAEASGISIKKSG
jgi:hypothetical protein